MEFLDYVFLDNSVKAWIMALAVGSGVFIGIRWLRAALERRLRKLAERTQNDLDDLAANIVGKTKLFFPLFIAIYAVARLLQLPDLAEGAIRGATLIAVLVQAAIWLNAAVRFMVTGYMERRMEEDAAAATMVGALRFLASLIIWTTVLLLALDNFGIDITTLVTGLGIGGIAVALALQNVLGDLFASLSIVLDKPFVIGDFIIVGDLLGTVEYIGLKTTRVRALSGEQLVFSNSDLLNSRIRNFKRMFERRIVFSFGVVYQTPREKLETIPATVREIIESQENTRFDRAHFKGFGDFSLDFEVVYYVLVPDYNVYMDIQQAINLEIYRRFEEQEIEFAFPTRTLYLRREEGAEV